MRIEHPSREDPVAAAMSEVIGGPMGEHSSGHPWWSASRALVAVTSLVLAAGMVGKSACVPSGWSKDTQPFAQLCWTELSGTSIEKSTPPHITTTLEKFAATLPGQGAVGTVAALAVLLAALALLATFALSRVDRSRPWAAAGWALSPVLLLHWLSWDLVAGVSIAVLLWGWTSGRHWLAGIGTGIGAAFALPVAAAFVGVLLIGGRTRDRIDAVVAAVAAYVLITIPGRARIEQADVGSIWVVVQEAGDGLPGRTVRLVVALLVLAAAAALVGWLISRERVASPRSAARAGLVLLAAALLVTPSAPPESALLLLPLAAIAVPRWRDLLVWQGCELVSWMITGWYFGNALVPTVSGDTRVYWLAIALRVVGMTWLVVAAVRPVLSGDQDTVEVSGGEPDADLDVLADGGHARA